MNGNAWFGLLGVALLVGTILPAEEPNVFEVKYSDALSSEQTALLDRLVRQLPRLQRHPSPKSALERLFRENHRAFFGVETDFLFFLLLATDYLHETCETLEGDEARESAELFKGWWGARSVGLTVAKGPIAPLIRTELRENYQQGARVVRLWTRYDYPRNS